MLDQLRCSLTRALPICIKTPATMEDTEPAMMTPALPDDALAAVLYRIPARAVAACRCVCKAWRDVVDARGLLLPRAVRGIFLNFIDYRCPRFFARPSSERPGNLGFLLPSYTRDHGSILDHCNGLLLYDGTFTGEFYVVNPATRRWQRLPPRMGLRDYVAYLVFDPAESPHYEVFLIPRVPEKPRPVLVPKYDPPTPVNLSWLFSLSDDETDREDTGEEEDRGEEEPVELPPLPRSIEEGFFPARFTPASSEPEDPYRLMEWPPSRYTFHVFSSCTGCWEERSFVREGEAVGTVEDVRLDSWLTLSLADGTYQVIKTPTSSKETYRTRFYLGRSEKGVYFAIIENGSQLQIWILDESNGQMDWVLKQHHIDLDPYVSRAIVPIVHSDYHERINGPWTLEDEDNNDNNKMLQNGDYEWDTNEDNILDEDGDEEQLTHYIDLLEFHPYKEIIFLTASFLGIAYHLNTSKVQYLGKLRPDDYNYTHAAGGRGPRIHGEDGDSDSPRARSPGAPSLTPTACCSHALRGIFINFVDHWCPRFFARPSSEPEPPGKLDFLPSYTRGHGSILDHCNGLLLYEGRFKREFFVVNPATRRWECLPRHTGFPDYYVAYLVFDPAVSPHYEVFLVPYFPETPRPVGVPRYDPPSPVNLHGLFSSPDDAPDAEYTEEEEDLTLTEEEPLESPLLSPRSTKDGWFSSPEPSEPDKDPDHLMESPLSPKSPKDGWCSSPEPSESDKDPDRLMEWPPSPYTFYVFSSCTGRWGKRSFVREGEVVGTAKDVKFDIWAKNSGPRRRYGVYWRRALYVHCRGAFVMSLCTSGFLTISLILCYFAVVHSEYHEVTDGPWILLENDHDNDNDTTDNDKVLQNGDYEWDSDEDNILDEDGDEEQLTDSKRIYFLGFHPYKEIIFLMTSSIGIAYHLNTSKVQFIVQINCYYCNCPFDNLLLGMFGLTKLALSG
ncbi:hypothetical protein PR202_gb19444 [Eleusine coracana subsp. coracana]|uniref:F-box domain-containing protein n=1 Tax=Eleusine coracana subsp. coracana TaxID=191504 RepID=A0AAV5F8T7_ELECO|nr:hypothetical protein PR202_gb19444 [Eleusine coracana subsp. coracana]